MTILVLGSNGLAGSAICRNLQMNKRNFIAATRSDVDLLNFKAVDKLLEYLHGKKDNIQCNNRHNCIVGLS